MDERKIKITSTYMPHSSGTKYYHLITVEDERTNCAVGLQVWGAHNAANPQHKFVLGSADSVRSQQSTKRSEKERTKSGGRYALDGPATVVEVPVSKAQAIITARLAANGVVSGKEMARKAMDQLGESFGVVSEEQQAEEQKVEDERKAKVRQERDKVYAGAWGAW